MKCVCAFGATPCSCPKKRASMWACHPPNVRTIRLDVHKAMQQLNDEQRLVVGLVLVEGLPYKEAAEVLGIPVGTLTSRLARARDTLQALLSDHPGASI